MVRKTRSRPRLTKAALLGPAALLASCSQAGPRESDSHAQATSGLVAEAVENLSNGSFTAGISPWFSYGIASESTASGAYCATAAVAANVWEAGVGQDVSLQAGESYSLSLVARGDPEPLHVAVQNKVTYVEYASLDILPTAAGATYEVSFTATEAVPSAQVIVQAANGARSRSFCVDDVSLLGGVAAPVYTPDTGPRVRVNQVGYLRGGPKHGTLVVDSREPLPWELRDATGQVVDSGETEPLADDAAAGLSAHGIDFSRYHGSGEGFTLAADGEVSYPFALGAQRYRELRTRALAVFYTQRSGEPIVASVAGEAYARATGHISTPGPSAVNQGDRAVPCQPPAVSLPIYGEAWTCDYTVDAVGGWYDAGDHGKYVVNGGIAVHQLLSTFERTQHAKGADARALGDGTLAVPEHGNHVPDILDEARHELEFFLKMQVPRGKPLAGMVHHKLHDSAWTGLPLDPARDPEPRWLHRPSTAATLNLAATAAEGARIYWRYQPLFSLRLLAAALEAWRAARAHPDLYAPASDNVGGGTYDDASVDDEFYWAAAELYLTTGLPQFRDYVLRSPLHTADVFSAEGFYWGRVAALGRLDLATIPSGLPDRRRVVASVVEAAERYLVDEAGSAFGQPYRPTNGVYAWGSNSQILNNLIVIGTAYDLTGDVAFKRGALQGIDYVFGRNALNISYVTGFGSVFSQNQHSRIYAHQLDPSLPNPPAGTLAGGPNSSVSSWDPLASRLFGLQGCAPQFCYVDDIQSYSTNELAINWNSALAWVASFIADQSAADGRP